MAILAGDGLLNGAMELMSRASLQRSDFRGLKALYAISRHAGITGMIAGQTADLEAEGDIPSEDRVKYIHLHKTADLLEAPMEAGLLLAGASEDRVVAGVAYGLHLGLAFQMTDDVLDLTGDVSLLGKKTGMDAQRGKMTWVSLRGLEGTLEDAAKQVSLAKEALSAFSGWDVSFLNSLADQTLKRIS